MSATLTKVRASRPEPPFSAHVQSAQMRPGGATDLRAHSRPSSAHSRPSSEGAGPTLRLTRRGRLVLLVLLVLAVLAAFSMGRATGSANAARFPTTADALVVTRGDTLWSIAQRVAPDADPRLVVPRLKQVNGLSSSELTVGQRLRVPTTNG